VEAARLRDRAAGDAVTAGEDDRLDGAVELGQRDLQRHLHRVQAELRVLPLLEGLPRVRVRVRVRVGRAKGVRVRVRVRRAKDKFGLWALREGEGWG
jgi:hypothetical protein